MFREQNDARGAKRKHCVLDNTIPAPSNSESHANIISEEPPRLPRPEQRRGYYPEVLAVSIARNEANETVAGSIQWPNYFEWPKAQYDLSAASNKIQAKLETDPSAPLIFLSYYGPDKRERLGCRTRQLGTHSLHGGNRSNPVRGLLSNLEPRETNLTSPWGYCSMQR